MLNLAVSALISGASAARTVDFETKVGNLSEYGNLYQSSYSANTNLVYVTSSVGRVPLKSSDLIAVDPDTLEIVQDRKPPTQHPINGTKFNVTQPYGVYSVSVDDKNNLVWVTNTRQGTVAYYKQDNLTIGNQYPVNIFSQSRQVYVNPKDHLAYVSDAREDVVAVFSPDNTSNYTKLINITQEIGTSFASVMGLTVDESSNTLYTVSLSEPLAAAIDLSTHEVKKYELGDSAKSSSDVAWDSKRSKLYVANQKTNNTIVLDPSSGKVVKSIDNIPGALSVAYEPTFDLVYVASRLGKFVAVIDPSDYSIIDHLDVPTPNEVSIGPDGSVFVTDHSAASGFYKFTPKNGSSSSNSSSNSTGSTPSASSSSSSSSLPAANGANVFKYSVGAGIAGVAALLI